MANKKGRSAKAALSNNSPSNTTKRGASRTSAKAQIYGLVVFLLSRNTTGCNRYEAEAALAVAHLARRIKDLKELGCKFVWSDEVAADHHGVEHRGIRRYRLTFAPAHLQKAAKTYAGGRHE